MGTRNSVHTTCDRCGRSFRFYREICKCGNPVRTMDAHELEVMQNWKRIEPQNDPYNDSK
jgi:ribosomal protein L37E